MQSQRTTKGVRHFTVVLKTLILVLFILDLAHSDKNGYLILWISIVLSAIYFKNDQAVRYLVHFHMRYSRLNIW